MWNTESDGDVGQHVDVEQGRAVQRSHRAERLMGMMLWHACARQNAFLVSQWHQTRPTRQVRPTCLSRARGVGLNLCNEIRSGAMCVREIERVLARSV
jgi:hypothetical protein